MSVLDRIPALYTPTLAVDIRDTLRDNGGEVTDNLLSFFQPKAGINWSSLRKPVVNSKIGVLTNEEMATSGAEIDSILGTYTTKRYGLNVAGRNSGITLHNLFLTVQALGDGIVYYLPQGGQSEPYRVSDFNGYYPAAPQPLFGALQGEVVINSVFDGLALDYFVSTGAKEGALTFDDLYEPTDENGNDIEWRTGVILKDGLDFTYIIDSINTTFLMENQEKTFEAVQFITSFPKGTLRPSGVFNEEWKNHRIFGIPNGIFSLTINKFPESGGSGGGGNVGVPSAFRISVGSEYPKFNGFGSGTTDIYKTVLIRFTVSFNSGVGNINSLSVRLYADKNHTNEIDYEQLGSFTDFFGSKDFNVTLNNTNLTTNAWVGIWLDGNLQFFKQVAMPRQERPTAI